MREKILTLIDLMFGTFTQRVDAQVNELRTGFAETFGEEVSGELKTALDTLHKALLDRREALDAPLVDIFSSTFNEEEVDAIIAFRQGPVGKKLDAVSPKVFESVKSKSSEWFKESMQIIEPELNRVLGAPTAAMNGDLPAGA